MKSTIMFGRPCPICHYVTLVHAIPTPSANHLAIWPQFNYVTSQQSCRYMKDAHNHVPITI